MFQWVVKVEQKARALFPKYGRYIPTVALLWGLFWDTLTLRRPDSLFENATVVGYLALAACAILILNLRRSRLQKEPSLILLAFMQFAFGNLMSALIVLFAKSGTLTGSLIFFAVFGTLLIGNEFVRDRYSKIHVHVAVWYVLLLSYSIIVIPILIGSIGDTVFLVSVLVSLAIAGGFLALLYAAASKELAARLFHTVGAIGGIAVLMTAFYFMGAIPPAPLMMRHIGIYHTLVRTADGDYQVGFEEPYWYEFFADTSRTYTHVADTQTYCASSVFAPARLETPIFHRWEYFDSVEEDWVQVVRVPFSIRGGRDNGFRGYSEISTLRAGTWRCNVETERQALIGRMTFEVVTSDAMPELSETVF